MAKKCFLCFSGETLDDAKKYDSVNSAVSVFSIVANDLAKYGQRIEACIHIANIRSEISEYPDLWLSLGPRGGLVRERA